MQKPLHGLCSAQKMMSFCSFFATPKGDLSDSVLWYFAQVLIYAGSVFGLKNYVDYKLKK